MAKETECVPPRFVYRDGVISNGVDALEPTRGDGVDAITSCTGEVDWVASATGGVDPWVEEGMGVLGSLDDGLWLLNRDNNFIT